MAWGIRVRKKRSGREISASKFTSTSVSNNVWIGGFSNKSHNGRINCFICWHVIGPPSFLKDYLEADQSEICMAYYASLVAFIREATKCSSKDHHSSFVQVQIAAWIDQQFVGFVLWQQRFSNLKEWKYIIFQLFVKVQQ